MYPAADIDELEAQIQITESLIKFMGLQSRSKDTLLKLAASHRQREFEKQLAQLQASRGSFNQLALVAEGPNGSNAPL